MVTDEKQTIGGEHAAGQTDVELYCCAPEREKLKRVEVKSKRKVGENTSTYFYFIFLHFLKLSKQ